MGVKLIGDDDPGCLGVSLDRLGDMGGEVSFGACGSKAGRDKLTGGHLQISNEAESDLDPRSNTKILRTAGGSKKSQAHQELQRQPAHASLIFE